MVGIVRLLVGEKHRNVSEQGNMERIRNQGQGSREMGSLKAEARMGAGWRWALRFWAKDKETQSCRQI